MNDPADIQFSLLLWSLAITVAGLGWHLSNGWVRLSNASVPLTGRPWRERWQARLFVLSVAGGALGLGLNAALVLALEAQPLAFALRFNPPLVGALMLAGLLGGALVVAPSLGAAPMWRLLLSGALLAALAVGLHAGWLRAAGFRPGVVWRTDALMAAAAVLGLGLMLARWLAFSAAVEASPRHVLWRLAAALLAALTLMAGQQAVLLAAGLEAQKASVGSGPLSGAVLSLVCGVLVPLVMAAMALDLWLRRQLRPRRGESGLQLQKRRKRRQRLRTL